MILIRLAVLSLRNRWFTVLLTVFAVALSVALFLGVEKVRNGARASFADTISGTDLIVGARTGGIQLLLYSVFRIGNATNNISWQSYQQLARRDEVGWIVPLSLGESHRGFRVMGTSPDYFRHYKFRGGRSLSFASGRPFSDLFDAILGADAAAGLGYKMGDPLVVSHGLGEISHADHRDKPFRVAGILAKTGTPVDRTVLVSLEAIEAIHLDWKDGARVPGMKISADAVRRMTLTPKAVTAAMIGLKSKLQTFRLQRFVNEYEDEALLAILPGVALQELWDIVATAEQALIVVSAMVVLAALLGLTTMMLSTLNERRREMAVLRSVGAGPRTIVGLLMTEAGLLSLCGVLLGVTLLYAGLFLARPLADEMFGLYLPISFLSQRELLILLAVVGSGTGVCLLPAWRAYRMSLADGMTVRS
ncbi:MAG: ABC transporter permease [Hyphomicrobiales bacterium]|nr:ABC transporter permease [Hyphomicrobiales bacterium]